VDVAKCICAHSEQQHMKNGIFFSRSNFGWLLSVAGAVTQYPQHFAQIVAFVTLGDLKKND